MRAKVIARAARAGIASPLVVGPVYVLALTLLSRAPADVGALGDPRRQEAMHRFGSDLQRMGIAIVASAIGFGLLLGVAALVMCRLRRPSRAVRASMRARLVESGLVVASLHAVLLAWSMARTPQLYAARFYAQGGVRRAFQVVITDVLGPGGVLTLGVFLAVLFVRGGRLLVLARRAWRGGNARRFALMASAALLASAALRTTALVPVPPRRPAAHVPARSGPPPARRPNVLLIAADALRADRLDPRVAPELVALGERGARFERAYVSVPRTFSSWVTLLTGRHAHHHGIRSMFPTWEDRARDFDALPARLARAGYRTAVVSDWAGDIFGRIGLGFEHVDTPSFDLGWLVRQRALERETALLPLLESPLGRRLFPVMREKSDAADPLRVEADAERALDLVAGRGADAAPFFLTVFFSTAHFPYAAPAPHYRAFTDPRYRGRFKYAAPVGLAEDVALDAEDVAHVRALYDGGVRAVDEAVGRLLASLRARGLAQDTVVVVTADHGETLFEAGRGQGHGDHLFGDEGTHVPLIVVDPRRPPAPPVSTIVRDVDLAPTLYAITGVTAPPDLDGASLVPALDGAPLEPRLAFAETELWFTEVVPGVPPELRLPYPGILQLIEIDGRHHAEIVLRDDVRDVTTVARHRMVRDARFKLLYAPTRQGARYFLYDTERDPAETEDVAPAFPEEVARLRRALWSWMLEDPRMEQRDGLLVPAGVVAGAARSPVRP